jgi:hypothetical protein
MIKRMVMLGAVAMAIGILSIGALTLTPPIGGYTVALLLGAGIGLITGGAVGAIAGLFIKPKQKQNATKST